MKKFFVGVKAVIKDDRGVLILHRNIEVNDYWDIPGGRMDEGEDFFETITREVSEELPGARVKAIQELVGVHRLNKDIGDSTGLLLVYFLVSADVPSEIILSEEHDAHMFIMSQDKIPKDKMNDEIIGILSKILPK